MTIDIFKMFGLKKAKPLPANRPGAEAPAWGLGPKTTKPIRDFNERQGYGGKTLSEQSGVSNIGQLPKWAGGPNKERSAWQRTDQTAQARGEMPQGGGAPTKQQPGGSRTGFKAPNVQALARNIVGGTRSGVPSATNIKQGKAPSKVPTRAAGEGNIMPTAATSPSMKAPKPKIKAPSNVGAMGSAGMGGGSSSMGSTSMPSISFSHDVGGGTDMADKNFGSGAVLPSSEEPEDQHPDEDKKKTPNGGEGDGE